MLQKLTCDPARLHEAMVYAAYLVERYGDAYAPVFERLADEWDAHQQDLNLRERASRVLDEAEAEAGGRYRDRKNDRRDEH